MWSVGSLARKRGVECGVTSPKAMCGVWGQPESDVWSVGSPSVPTFSRAVSRSLGAAICLHGLAGSRVSLEVLH